MDDTKQLKQQLFDLFWQYLSIRLSMCNFISSIFLAFLIGTTNISNLFLSFVSLCLWNNFLYESGSCVLKFYSIQSKSRSNQLCDLAYLPCDLNLSSFLFYLSSVIFKTFQWLWPLVHIILVFLPLASGHFDICWYIKRYIWIYLVIF